MDKQKVINTRFDRRKKRIRKKVRGVPQRPRLAVFRSLRHMYAQIIDDESGITLASASTLSDKPDNKISNPGNVAAAMHVGQVIAKKGVDIGIRQIRFDRHGYKYHGRVKALAEAARKGGLVF
ncbi:MAG: 50S ribosomal protein L18 [Sedimentisphaerales bacterium]|nr:50S ribosomal protein L18 [Sedimentisphaerales bacterium]